MPTKPTPTPDAATLAQCRELGAAWDGQSTGTADMIRRAKAKGLRVHVYNYVTGEVTE